MVDLLIILKEAKKEIAIISTIEHSSSFTDGMHAPHWCAHIHSLNSCLASHNRTDGTPAG